MAENVATKDDLSSRLIGKEVRILVKSRSEQDLVKYKGKIVSLKPGVELSLDTGLGAEASTKLPFCGVFRGIYSIGEITRSGGHEGVKPLYFNHRVYEVYKFDPWGDSILEDKAAREIISSHGEFF